MPFPASSTISDPFDRSGESPLSFGGRWVEYVDALGFNLIIGAGDTVRNNTHGDSIHNPTVGALWVADGQLADTDSWLGVNTLAPGHVVLLARAQTPGGLFTARDGYECDFSTSGVTIFATAAGTRTSLDSYSHLFSAGDAIGFSVRGSTLQAWAWFGYATGGTGGWQLLLSVTDSTYTTGYPGFYLNALQPSVAAWVSKPSQLMTVWVASFHGRGT